MANSEKRAISYGMAFLTKRPNLFNKVLKEAHFINSFPRWILYNKLNNWGKEHEMPRFAKESFREMWKKGKIK